MFPTKSKANRLGRLWLLPVVALAMLLVGYVAMNASKAQAQTYPGDFCVEGIVINWEEKPLAGWTITLSSSLTTTVRTTVSAPEPEEDEDDPDLLKGEFEFKDLLPAAPGTYTATIESRAGWEGVTPTTFTFPIDANEDDCVKIRFKMRRIVQVIVYKIDAEHNGLNDWKIKAVPGPGNLFASPEIEETGTITNILPITGTTPTTVTGAAIFTLTPGSWIFLEQPPKDNMNGNGDSEGDEGIWKPVVPPNGRQELDIDDDAVDPVRVVFKNELVTGCLVVRKFGALGAPTEGNGQSNASNAYGVGGWSFELQRKDGSVARRGVTGADGTLEFDYLPLGPYILVEEDRPGWAEVSPGRELEVKIEASTCDEVTPIDFRNEQDDSGFCIEGRKIDANGGYGIPNWEIEIEPLDEGGYDPKNVFTDGLGEFTINFPKDDYRIPGARYEICEDDQDGWLPHTPTCQTVRLPEWPGACVELKDFVNQQVGHSESEKMWDMPKKDGGMSMGPDMGKGMDSCSNYHVAKKGEGLYDIGKMYNKSAREMLDANPMVKNHPQQWVYEGQKICIP